MAARLIRVSDFVCFKCDTVVLGNYKQLTRHFREQHAFLTTTGLSHQPLMCAQNGCRLVFNTWCNYNYHIRVCSRLNRQAEEAAARRAPANGFVGGIQNEEPIPEELENDPYHRQIALTHQLAIVMLRLRAKHQVPQIALDYLAVELIKVFGENQDADPVTSFKALNTGFKRQSYFKKNFGLFEPESVTLGHRFDVKRNKNGQTMPSLVQETFQYTALKKYFNVLFQNAAFRNLISSEEPSADGFIRSHRDAEHCRTHHLFTVAANGLRLQFFFDEVETVNPLGSKTKDHELGMFYFRILNLPASDNSRYQNVYNFATAYSRLLSKDGFDAILGMLISELKELESNEGMKLDIPTEPDYRVRGTVVAVCGDTKGLHEMFGFMSPAANMFCRGCLIHRSEIHQKKTLESTQKRTRENYEQAAYECQEEGRDSAETGVVYACSLNQSKKCALSFFFINRLLYYSLFI